MGGDGTRRARPGTVEVVRNVAGIRVLSCGALALASMAALAGAAVARPHVDVALRLNGGRLVPATTVLAVLGLGGLAVAAVGLRFPRLALVGVASLSMAMAVAWLGLTDHRFSGPVVTPLSPQHGLHVTDGLAIAPALVGLVALALAARPRPRPHLAPARR